MTDLATRIADARKKVDDSLSQWTSGLPISRSLFIEMADEIDRLTAELEKAREEINYWACACKKGDCWDSYRNDNECPRRRAARVHAELAEKEKV